MKAARRNPVKEPRDMITFVTAFVLTVTGPAALIAGVILIVVSHSEMLSGIVLASIFAATITGIFLWPRRRLTAIQGQRITVHAFVSHVRMYPELLPLERTEFDLERFRKQWGGHSQMTLNAWIKQFSGESRTTSPFR